MCRANSVCRAFCPHSANDVVACLEEIGEDVGCDKAIGACDENRFPIHCCKAEGKSDKFDGVSKVLISLRKKVGRYAVEVKSKARRPQRQQLFYIVPSLY